MPEVEYAEMVRNAAANWPLVVLTLKRRHPNVEHELIEDCAEDALIKFSEKIKTGWIMEKVMPWLIAAAELYFRNEYRKLHGQRSLDDLAWEPGAIDETVRELEDEDEAEKILGRMKNADYREAVRLIDYEDYSVKEAAELMGKSEEAVYHLKERGEKEARRICEEELGISPPARIAPNAAKIILKINRKWWRISREK
ncbi:MAG TPA: sigma-70 family RNA polymerase sigma factor [Candidatus Kapabacteria bacterium]|nr:sigma-70 family RNA polymerase sigma factor [Candidatus Kapabacteria bacterium]